MRISDWSSDVCSSDLCGKDFPQGARIPDHLEPDRVHQRIDARGAEDAARGDAARRHRHHRLPAKLARRDRKSVVSGKSVLVRVALGGRRIIIKKKLTIYKSYRKCHQLPRET